MAADEDDLQEDELDVAALDEELDETELEDELDEELADDALALDVDVEDVVLGEEDEEEEDTIDVDALVAPVEESDAEEDDDEEEADPDDVEADLDAILKDRMVAVEDDEEDDEEEVVDPEDKSEGGKVRPRAPGEFVCQSCFLVKHPNQLADPVRQFCTDCV
ncbi:MAG TPA: DUF4193 family protein [Acidimicrobiales bacterium]|jgi:hypothetical protein